MNRTPTRQVEMEGAILVYPLTRTVMRQSVWRVCTGSTSECIGLFEDVASALLKAVKLAQLACEQGQLTSVWMKYPAALTWSLAWKPSFETEVARRRETWISRIASTIRAIADRYQR